MKMPTQNIDWELVFKRYETACIIVSNKIIGFHTYGHLKVLTYGIFSNLLMTTGYMKDPYLLRFLFDDLEIYSELTQTRHGFKSIAKSNIRKYVISDFPNRIDAEYRCILSSFNLLNEVAESRNSKI
jgi:hypothetical protein